MNKLHCCHCSAICSLIPTFLLSGLLFFLYPLSPFFFFFFPPRSFPSCLWVVIFFIFHWLLFDPSTNVISHPPPSFLNKNAGQNLSAYFILRVCGLQWTYTCIGRKIKFKCNFCFGWNAWCHYYILVFILTNPWFLGAVTSCVLAARNFTAIIITFLCCKLLLLQVFLHHMCSWNSFSVSCSLLQSQKAPHFL